MDIQGFIIDSWISRMNDNHPVLTVYDPDGSYTSLLSLAVNKGITASTPQKPRLPPTSKPSIAISIGLESSQRRE